MRNAGLEEAQAGIKIARRIISNLRYADDTTLMAESRVTKNWTWLSDWTELNWKSVLKMIQEIIQGKIQISKRKSATWYYPKCQFKIYRDSIKDQKREVLWRRFFNLVDHFYLAFLIKLIVDLLCLLMWFKNWLFPPNHHKLVSFPQVW